MSEERLSFTRIEAASLCGLSVRQFDEAIRPRAKAAEKGTGRHLRFDGSKIVAALVAYRIEQTLPQDEDSALLVGGGAETPALERLRLAKAKMAERDLEERDATLVRVHIVRDTLRPAIAAMRSAGDRLVLQFGNEAGDIYNEGITEFEAAALRGLAANDVGSCRDDGVSPVRGLAADAPAPHAG